MLSFQISVSLYQMLNKVWFVAVGLIFILWKLAPCNLRQILLKLFHYSPIWQKKKKLLCTKHQAGVSGARGNRSSWRSHPLFWNLNRQVWQDAASQVWSCSGRPGAQKGKVGTEIQRQSLNAHWSRVRVTGHAIFSTVECLGIFYNQNKNVLLVDLLWEMFSFQRTAVSSISRLDSISLPPVRGEAVTT